MSFFLVFVMLIRLICCFFLFELPLEQGAFNKETHFLVYPFVIPESIVLVHYITESRLNTHPGEDRY